MTSNTNFEISLDGLNIYIEDSNQFLGFINLYNSNYFDNKQNITFHLMTDIDVENDTTLPSINNFKETHIFSGHGNKIYNIKLETTETDKTLFIINNGTIENLILCGSVTAKNNCSGLVGTNNATGIIRRIRNECSITATETENGVETNAAGICCNNYGTISECCNYGTIKGTYKIAGIASYIYENSIVSNCYNKGTITALYDYAGGVVGCMSNGQIVNSYNSGDLTNTTHHRGGIVGFSIYSSPSVTTSCYLSSTATEAFGNYNPSIADDPINYFPISSTDLKDKTKIASFEFDKTWLYEKDYSLPSSVIGTEYFYPVLSFEFTWNYATDISWFKENDRNHYEISTPEQFVSLATLFDELDVSEINCKYHFFIVNDLDFKTKVITKQIGNESKPFEHIINGQNYSLKNILLRKIDGETADDKTTISLAIFGINKGLIKNITIETISSISDVYSCSTLVDKNYGKIIHCLISGATVSSSVAGMSGLCFENYDLILNCGTKSSHIYNTDSTSSTIEIGSGGLVVNNFKNITNCVNFINISSIADYVGGICSINKGNISCCNTKEYNSELLNETFFTDVTDDYSINGRMYCGGIAGKNLGGIISLNSNYQKVKASLSIAGGIAGLNTSEFDEDNILISTAIIEECKNMANVETPFKCGGITGSNEYGMIKNCLNRCSGLTCNEASGGISGDFYGTMKFCYSTSPISTTIKNCCGGIIGKIVNSMSYKSFLKNNYTASGTSNTAIGGTDTVFSSFDTEDCAETINISLLSNPSTYKNYDFENVWRMTTDDYAQIQIELTSSNNNFVPLDNNSQTIGRKTQVFNKVFINNLELSKNGKINGSIDNFKTQEQLPFIHFENSQWEISDDGDVTTPLNLDKLIGTSETPPEDVSLYFRLV